MGINTIVYIPLLAIIKKNTQLIDKIVRIEKAEIKKIFHESEFALSLIVADLPLEVDMSNFESLGLNLKNS